MASELKKQRDLEIKNFSPNSKLLSTVKYKKLTNIENANLNYCDSRIEFL